MKKLIVILLLLVTSVYSQSNFTQEWESPSNRNFVRITSLEQSNTIPEIILSNGSSQVFVHDGATKQIKYSYSDTDTSDFNSYAVINSRPIDVNNDGIFEIVSEKKFNVVSPGQHAYYTFRVLNGATGQILFQKTWNDAIGELQMLDIDGDEYTEICVQLWDHYPEIKSLKIYSTTSNYIGIKNTNSEVGKYELKQNYSNPFNPNTKIEYTLSKSADVRLVIYDITGKEVALLVNEKQNAGTYIKNLNGTNLSSGTYFYQLLVNGIPESKKMILIK